LVFGEATTTCTDIFVPPFIFSIDWITQRKNTESYSCTIDHFLGYSIDRKYERWYKCICTGCCCLTKNQRWKNQLV
jgi:hypothetical protein